MDSVLLEIVLWVAAVAAAGTIIGNAVWAAFVAAFRWITGGSK